MEQQPTQGRKNEARHRVLKGAQIVFKGHEAVIDCVVRNLSNRGACLKVESPIGIPDTFDLVRDHASVRHCRVTWRRATQIGVNFAESIVPAPPRSAFVWYGHRMPNQVFWQPLSVVNPDSEPWSTRPRNVGSYGIASLSFRVPCQILSHLGV